MTMKKNILICCVLLSICTFISGSSIHNNTYDATASHTENSVASMTACDDKDMLTHESNECSTTGKIVDETETSLRSCSVKESAQCSSSVTFVSDSANPSEALSSTHNKNRTEVPATTTTATTTVAALPTPMLPKYVLTSFDSSLVEKINAERKKAGLGTLSISSEICDIAAIRAKEASVSWSHTRPSGGLCNTLFDEYDVEWTLLGENLAHASSSDVDNIVAAWMNSTNHRANILNASFATCGIATYVSDNGDIYIAQIFSK